MPDAGPLKVRATAIMVTHALDSQKPSSVRDAAAKNHQNKPFTPETELE
jgi:hypothetical protein